MIRFLEIPLPILVAMIAPQIDKPPSGDSLMGAPEWVSVFLAGVFVVLWLLNAIGKLPGAHGERRKVSFTDEDRATLHEALAKSKKLSELLATRNDDGMERILVMAQQTRETHDRLADVAKSLEKTAMHLETIAKALNRTA